MDSQKPRRKATKTANSRWIAYAAASAAGALTSSQSAEAEIHYSGFVNHQFSGTNNSSGATFPLDNGVFFRAGRRSHVSRGTGFADIRFSNAQSSFVGQTTIVGFSTYVGYFSKLAQGINLSGLPFATNCSRSGTGCFGGFIGYGSSPYNQFTTAGRGFIGFGFRFDRGAGLQYAWVRVKDSGNPLHRFVLVDYAWGDPGDSLATGQKSSSSKAEVVPDSGSLGLLAVGGAGLLAWRKRRLKAALAE